MLLAELRWALEPRWLLVLVAELALDQSLAELAAVVLLLPEHVAVAVTAVAIAARAADAAEQLLATLTLVVLPLVP